MIETERKGRINGTDYGVCKTRTYRCGSGAIFYRDCIETDEENCGQIHSVDPGRNWDHIVRCLGICILFDPHSTGNCNGSFHGPCTRDPGGRCIRLCRPDAETAEKRGIGDGKI